MAEPQAHIYHRELDHEVRSTLSAIADRIRPASTVLDLGCGTGALGRYLYEQLGCIVDGITISDEEARIAGAAYRHMVVGDVEECDLAHALRGSRYDTIVCADVLEHLRRPDQLLNKLALMLTDDGLLLVSVPNAAYAGLIAELLEGEFRYRPEGLLDATHLRFYTRRSIIRLLEEGGWHATVIEAISRGLWDSEFRPALEMLPPAVRNHLLSRRDAFAYQFLVAAHRNTAGAIVETSNSAEAQRAEFSLSIYLRSAQGYSERMRVFSRGAICAERQTVRFELPAEGDEKILAIRLDPADRPGLMALYAIRLQAGDERCIWQWDGQAQSLQAGAHNDVAFPPAAPDAQATMLLLTGDDPYFELPVPSEILRIALVGGCRLEVDLGWPMSADYCAMVPQLLQLQVERNDLARRLEASAALAERAQFERNGLRAELDALLASTVFRASRPLVRWTMAIQRAVSKLRRGP